MNPNVIIKMIHDNNSDIILNLFICLLFNGFSASSVLLLFKLYYIQKYLKNQLKTNSCGTPILRAQDNQINPHRSPKIFAVIHCKPSMDFTTHLRKKSKGGFLLAMFTM